jgi:DUF1365 family protein
MGKGMENNGAMGATMHLIMSVVSGVLRRVRTLPLSFSLHPSTGPATPTAEPVAPEPVQAHAQACQTASERFARVPQLLSASVRHHRLIPKENEFEYQMYYLVLPLRQMPSVSAIAVDRAGLMSFHSKDYGARDGSDLRQWIDGHLQEQGLDNEVVEVVLITTPRILGYAFNPVNFWLCLDAQSTLRAVLCEVNNTFGEHHFYSCVHADKRPLSGDDWLVAQKCFHVSPFLPRDGHYAFKFQVTSAAINIWIHYYDRSGQLKLITSVKGQLAALTRQQLRRALWANPWVGVKAMTLIHWQALKLWGKRIRFFPKPTQFASRFTTTDSADTANASSSIVPRDGSADEPITANDIDTPSATSTDREG